MSKFWRAAVTVLALAACGTAACGSAASDAEVERLAPRACDPVRQDCPADQKCADDRCVPAGDGALGDDCADDAERVDTCARGLRCSPLNVAGPDGSWPRACRALCDGDEDCGVVGERCTGTPARAGVCVAPCALFGRDCPVGRTCAYPFTGIGFSTCRYAGTLAVGDACAGRENECPAESICLARGGLSAACYRLCDVVDRGAALHGCPSGSCVNAFGLNRPVGICWP